ncbi:MAG: hypothetical protein JOZ99_13590 [Actinobacteria bacterium]|nr:hypothetical protein [Actinomycetota bacterium]
MASRRARREQAEESPVWDVWLLTALLSAVLLMVGGWMQARLLGAVAGALVGVAVGAVTLSHNATAKAALFDTVFMRHRRNPHP